MPFSECRSSDVRLPHRQFRLFVDLNKLSGSLKKELQEAGVLLHPYASFYEQLAAFARSKAESDKFCVSTSPLFALFRQPFLF